MNGARSGGEEAAKDGAEVSIFGVDFEPVLATRLVLVIPDCATWFLGTTLRIHSSELRLIPRGHAFFRLSLFLNSPLAAPNPVIVERPVGR